jgi:drug/metabolite transporter (DMT)-like permease
MFYLIGSIIFSSWLTISFKVIERFGINNLQAIVFNYFACVITGSIINGSFPIDKLTFKEPSFPWAIVMGFIFVSLFNLVALTAQKLGVAIASVAYKLSLVIPFLFSIYLYDEVNTVVKTIGIGVALIAVVLTCYKPTGNSGSHRNNFSIFLLPVILFFGSGFLDTMIKYVEQTFLNSANNNDYLITAFLFAALVGSILLGVQLLRKKQQFSWKSVIAGICIGIPNYLSIWCLLKVLKAYGTNSSAIIPINNMGIVLFSSVTAFILFKEKLTMVNWVGILFALGAIALIAYG